jgi:hypothetical protein
MNFLICLDKIRKYMISSQYDINAPALGGAGFGGGMPFGGGFGGFGGGGCGFGGLSPFGLFGILGLGGRGGLFGGGEERGHHGGGCNEGRGGVDCRESIFDMTVLAKLGSIESAIPTATAAINAQTVNSTQSVKDNLVTLAAATNQAFQTQLLATLQSTNTVKDSITIAAAASAAQTNDITSLIAATTCAIKGVVQAEGDATRALINANALAALRDELNEARHHSRSKDTEVNITNTLTNTSVQQQQQQQAQAQAQFVNDSFNKLFCRLNAIEQHQSAVASNINFGSGVNQGARNDSNQVGRI